MRPLTLILIALTLPSIIGAVKADTVRIPLRRETPLHLLQALPQYGLDKNLQISGDEKDNSLLVQGSAQSIEALKRVIVVRENFVGKVVKLTMQVVCVRFAEDGTWTTETVSSPGMLTTLSQKAVLSQDSRNENNEVAHHLSIEVTSFWKYLDPKNPNSGNVIEMKGAFSVLDTASQFDNAVVIQGKLQPGKKLIVGVTDSTDPQLRATVAGGRFPSDVKTPVTVYYLHITPTFIPDR